MTILEVPYYHRATVVLLRHRTPKEVLVRARVPVKLRTVPAAAAPLAATCTIAGRRCGDQPVPYRLLDGVLMAPWVAPPPNSHWDQWPLPTAAADLQALLDGGAANPFFERPTTLPPWVLADGDAVRRWDTDDRYEVAGRLLTAAARCAVIDGVLFAPSDGPAWEVTVSHHDTGYRARVEARPRPGPEPYLQAYSSGHDPSRTFRGDRLADALALAKRIIERANGTPGRVGTRGAIAVRIPDAFAYDDDGPAWRHAVKDGALALCGNNLLEWPTEAATAWFALRDAHRAEEAGRSGWVASLAAAQRLLTLIDAHGLGGMWRLAHLRDGVARLERSAAWQALADVDLADLAPCGA